MVVAHVGDDPHLGLDDLLLGRGLELRLHGHALQDQHLCALPICPPYDGQLLQNVGSTQPPDRVLCAGGIDTGRVRACGLGEYPHTRPPQAGVDQAAYAGLSPDAVDVDYTAEGGQGLVIEFLFTDQGSQVAPDQEQDKWQHSSFPLPTQRL